jgi:hypothetical protein
LEEDCESFESFPINVVPMGTYTIGVL